MAYNIVRWMILYHGYDIKHVCKNVLPKTRFEMSCYCFKLILLYAKNPKQSRRDTEWAKHMIIYYRDTLPSCKKVSLIIATL